MPTRLLLVHYTPPGVIGGVEHIMHQHIQVLQARGFQIEVVAGRDGNHAAPVHLLPEIDPASVQGQLIEAELARGSVGEPFHAAYRSIAATLRPLVERADCVITHNAYTLHFSLPLTAVLWDLGAGQPEGTMIAWCHDLAWTNPLYRPLLHAGYPWSLLREPAPRTTYIAVSEERRSELVGLWGDGHSQVTVIPNGIDLLALWRFSPLARHIVQRFRLLDCDLVLLLPVRITRRKNVEAAIRAVRALKDRGLAVRFLVTAPLASDHPGLSNGYLDSLKTLRTTLGVEKEVVFLADALDHSLEIQLIVPVAFLATVAGW
jgi:glycosyltransferase involved in cell wall biosynthesis